MDDLTFCEEDAILVVEINGVQHEVHEVIENSQGVTLFVDTDQEERDMR
jgi:hypothetical protein